MEVSPNQEVSATQKGAIGESIVAIQLITESQGRLSPFTPVADDAGIDLLVCEKATGHALPLQVKSRTATIRKSPNVVHFQVRKATFKEYANGYVLGILLDDSGALPVFERGWLVPMKDLPKVAMLTEANYVMRPSKSTSSEDKYSDYRCKSFGDVVWRLNQHFDSMGA